jgi:hypothetical protein
MAAWRRNSSHPDRISYPCLSDPASEFALCAGTANETKCYGLGGLPAVPMCAAMSIRHATFVASASPAIRSGATVTGHRGALQPAAAINSDASAVDLGGLARKRDRHKDWGARHVRRGGRQGLSSRRFPPLAGGTSRSHARGRKRAERNRDKPFDGKALGSSPMRRLWPGCSAPRRGSRPGVGSDKATSPPI